MNKNKCGKKCACEKDKECTCTCQKNECKCGNECKCNDGAKELEAKVKTLEEKVLRNQADYANSLARSEKYLSDMMKYDGEKVLVELLNINDNFERAFKMDDRDLSDEVSKFLEGFKMIYVSLQTLFEKMEVKEIDCLGKPFDPTTSEAVIVESDETKPADVVLEVLNKGYYYKDKIIRHAMVKVNK